MNIEERISKNETDYTNVPWSSVINSSHCPVYMQIEQDKNKMDEQDRRKIPSPPCVINTSEPYRGEGCVRCTEKIHNHTLLEK